MFGHGRLVLDRVRAGQPSYLHTVSSWSAGTVWGVARRTPQTAMKREREQKRKERRALKDAKKLARKEAALDGRPVDPEDDSEPS